MKAEEQVLAWLRQQDLPIYLVGGSVRDRLLGRPGYDLDLAIGGDGLALARGLANRFRGAYYPLDRARGTGRAILTAGEGHRLVVDVARFRGPDLAADLADRDFTVNALAVDIRAPGDVIDRHGGLADLAAGIIRPVSEASIRNDPLRALRAVRQAVELGFVLAPETKVLIRRDGAALASVSDERTCDELARLLALSRAAPGLQQLDALGLLTVIFPELEPLRGLAQPAPHYLDTLAHSLQTVDMLETLIVRLAANRPGRAGPVHPEPLAPFAGRIEAHLAQVMGDARPRLVTLKLAALMHDTGKAATVTQDPEGRIRFLDHDQEGASIAGQALRRLRLTNAEVRLGETIVRHHMRPLLLASQPGVSSRAVYRFFRDTREAGVDVLLHALADHLATYAGAARGAGLSHAPTDTGDDLLVKGISSELAEGPCPELVEGPPRPPADEIWNRLVALAARMLADYWQRGAERVSPPPLVDGNDLLREFGLQPGPLIGRLLEQVREAQVSGEVCTREEALALVRRHLQ